MKKIDERLIDSFSAGTLGMCLALSPTLPPDARLAICQRSLAERVQRIAPGARVYPVDDYIHAPAYDEVIRLLTTVVRG